MEVSRISFSQYYDVNGLLYNKSTDPAGFLFKFRKNWSNYSGAGITSSSSLLDERREAETSKYYVPTITAVGFSLLLFNHLKV